MVLQSLCVVSVVNLLSNVYLEVDLWKGGKSVKIVYNPTTLQVWCGEPLSIKRSRNTKATSTASDINVVFSPSVELPTKWDTSLESVNLSEELLAKLKMRCMQQRDFDKQALVNGMCYNCGCLLWSTNTTSLISPPNGICADSAPASAYLQAVPNCNIHL